MKTIVDVVSAMKNYVDNRDPSFNPAETTIYFTDIITVENAFPKPAKDVKVKVDAVQDLHGYDNPWVGGAGKNKLNMLAPNAVSNMYGITGTVNADSSVKLVGTATDLYTFPNDTSQLLASEKDLKPNTTYTVSLGIPQDTSRWAIQIYYKETASSGWAGGETFYGTTATFTTPSNLDSLYLYWVRFCGLTNKTFNDTVYPQIEEGSTATSFESYENICPISGWDNAKVTREDKNLLPTRLASLKTLNPGGSWNGNTYSLSGITAEVVTSGDEVVGIKLNGISNATFSFILWNGTNPTDFNGKILSGFTGGTGGTGIRISDTVATSVYNYSGDTLITGLTATNQVAVIIRIDSGKTFNNQLVRPMISKDGGDFEPYQGEEITISLNGTRYGGTLDVTSGVLTLTHKSVDMETLEWYRTTSYTYPFFYAGISDSKVDGEIIASCYEKITNLKSNQFGANAGNGQCCHAQDTNQVFVRNDAYTDTATFTTAMTGQTFVYELATPQTIQLTPTEVKLLQGYNTLYADSGDISLTYDPATLGNVVEEVGGLEDDVQDLTNYVADTGVKNLLDVYTTTSSDYAVSSNGTCTNTLVDTRTPLSFVVQGRKGSTFKKELVTARSISNTGYYEVSFAITSDDDIDNLRIGHNGGTRNILLVIPWTKTGSFTISFKLTSNDPTTVGGLVLTELMIRDASITDATYQPYAKTNVELTSELTEVSDAVSYLSNYINANIDYETLHATISGGTATFTGVPTSDSTKKLDFYTSVPGLDYTNISVSGTTVTLTYGVQYNGQIAFCVISPLEHTY